MCIHNNYFVSLQQATAYGTQAPAASTGGYDYGQTATAAAGGQAGSYSNGQQAYGQQAASAQQPAYSSYGQTATTESSYGQQCKRINWSSWLIVNLKLLY